MPLQAERCDLIGGRLDAAAMVAAIELGRDLEADTGAGGTGAVEDLLVESSASPSGITGGHADS